MIYLVSPKTRGPAGPGSYCVSEALHGSGPPRVLNGPTGQVSEVGPLGQSKWMSETGLD